MQNFPSTATWAIANKEPQHKRCGHQNGNRASADISLAPSRQTGFEKRVIVVHLMLICWPHLLSFPSKWTSLSNHMIHPQINDCYYHHQGWIDRGVWYSISSLLLWYIVYVLLPSKYFTWILRVFGSLRRLLTLEIKNPVFKITAFVDGSKSLF